MSLFDAITRVKPPPPRNFGNEIGQIVSQSGRVAGAQYDEASQYDPLYSALNRRTANTALLGGDGAPGYVDIYGGGLSALLAKLGSAATASVSSGVPSYVSTLRAANPGQTELYDLINRTATSGLKAGSALTPDQTFNAVNPSRADWASRGFGESLPGNLDAAVNLARSGDNVLGQRQAAATSAAALGNELYTNPAFNAARGDVAAGEGSLGSLLGLGSTTSRPDTFNPLMQYGSDVFNTSYNANAAAKIASANNETGFASTLASY